MFRAFTIWRILAKYRLHISLLRIAYGGKPKERSKGEFIERVATALEELGPGFIKVGQILATRADLIGVDNATRLAVLQDNLTPFSWGEVKRAISQDLGGSVKSHFKSFETTPKAAASVAQVHFAVTHKGEKVAVKVLRPNVERLFEADFRLFRFFIAIAQRLFPTTKRLRLPSILNRLEHIIRAEMNLTMEAAHCDQLAENLRKVTNLKIPKIYWDLSGKRVLTMERLDGVRIDSPKVLRLPKATKKAIIATAAEGFFRQVFVDGFFHADLHPGNILIGKSGEVQLVDFGITEHLDNFTRRTLGRIFLAFLNRNYDKMALEHLKAGYAGGDQFDLSLACRAIGESVRGKSIGEISMARVIARLLETAARFNAEAQPQLLMLQKNILLTESITRKLMPQTNVWRLLEPHLKEQERTIAKLKRSVAPLLEKAALADEILPRAVSGGLGFLVEGVRLHPESVARLQAPKTGSYAPLWLILGISLGIGGGVLLGLWLS